MLTEGNPKSSRRFVTLIVSGIFILTCLVVIILLIALFISTTKLQGVNIEALKAVVSLIQDVLKYEVLIVVSGLFVTTVAGRVRLFDSIFKKSDSFTDYTNTTTSGSEGADPPKTE